jgi:hypothetical protein
MVGLKVENPMIKGDYYDSSHPYSVLNTEYGDDTLEEPTECDEDWDRRSRWGRNYRRRDLENE